MRKVWSIIVVAALAACSGGGSTSPTPAPQAHVGGQDADVSVGDDPPVDGSPAAPGGEKVDPAGLVFERAADFSVPTTVARIIAAPDGLLAYSGYRREQDLLSADGSELTRAIDAEVDLLGLAEPPTDIDERLDQVLTDPKASESVLPPVTIGDDLVFPTSYGRLVRWNPETDEVTRVGGLADGRVAPDVAFAGDHVWFSVWDRGNGGDFQGFLDRVDTNSGEVVAEISLGGRGAYAMAAVDDERFVMASVGEDGAAWLELRDADTGDVLREWKPADGFAQLLTGDTLIADGDVAWLGVLDETMAEVEGESSDDGLPDSGAVLRFDLDDPGEPVRLPLPFGTVTGIAAHQGFALVAVGGDIDDDDPPGAVFAFRGSDGALVGSTGRLYPDPEVPYAASYPGIPTVIGGRLYVPLSVSTFEDTARPVAVYDLVEGPTVPRGAHGASSACPLGVPSTEEFGPEAVFVCSEDLAVVTSGMGATSVIGVFQADEAQEFRQEASLEASDRGLIDVLTGLGASDGQALDLCLTALWQVGGPSSCEPGAPAGAPTGGGGQDPTEGVDCSELVSLAAGSEPGPLGVGVACGPAVGLAAYPGASGVGVEFYERTAGGWELVNSYNAFEDGQPSILDQLQEAGGSAEEADAVCRDALREVLDVDIACA